MSLIGRLLGKKFKGELDTPAIAGKLLELEDYLKDNNLEYSINYTILGDTISIKYCGKYIYVSDETEKYGVAVFLTDNFKDTPAEIIEWVDNNRDYRDAW